MTHYNYENYPFFTTKKALDIIQENKQLIYGINYLKGTNEYQEAKLRILLSRLQKNLFLLAHLCNQPKAPKHLSVNELLRPVFSCDYTNEKKITFQNLSSGRTPNLSINSPILTSNSPHPVYFDSNSLEHKVTDSKSSDINSSQVCENPNTNNISSNSLSKINFEPLNSISSDYEIIQSSIGIPVGNSSSTSGYIHNQNNEHFICRYCQRKCRNQSGLTQHTMKVHPDAPEVQHLLKQAQSRSTPNPLSIINVNSSIY